MAGIEQRLLKLEKSLGIHQADPRVFVARFQVALDPGPLMALEADNVHFRRLAGEDEEQFIERVVQTAPRPGRDCMLILLEATP